MSKLFLIFLLFISSNCVYLRPTNYDENKLNECLSEMNYQMNEGLKELLALFNKNRHFLFGKKSETMNLDKSVQDSLKQCFSKYGIYERMVGCTLDCHDKCDYYHKNDNLCKRRCPIC